MLCVGVVSNVSLAVAAIIFQELQLQHLQLAAHLHFAAVTILLLQLQFFKILNGSEFCNDKINFHFRKTVDRLVAAKLVANL